MLDTETKRRIDTARDILVGKVPDPKSQVEQITIALIYKFMDDMDAEAEEFGGERRFFAGEFAQYGWAGLMHGGLSGHDVLNLYALAISRMPENPGIPPLFRDIFNNAYLPYRDPETLRAFLKVIDEFNYDHSERLGDAFEYLLSVLGSQGDAGQFRTPRHIIDFIVAIIDPKKDETILDPACGTAGFLISSWKHIDETNIDEKGISTITPDERGRLAQNFSGYDISPDMVRLSLVNMYLHRIAQPRIHEYDTLTSEDRWNEYADVILANPPFMSPKGGIRPHNRFSVQSKRSEVLFVDYMAEHLTPEGRAGIIVPEGIIFQSQNAHRQLRRMLVEDYLVAVISLPAGVFNPYSGVKTSILILDRKLAKQTDRIAFFKVENDGFDLGAQRREIEKNDLPMVREELCRYLEQSRAGKTAIAPESEPTANVAEQSVAYATESFDSSHGLVVEKEKIAAGGEYNLGGERYRVNASINTEFEYVALGDVSEIRKGTAITRKDVIEGPIPVIAGGQSPSCFHNEPNRTGETITVSASGAYAGFVSYFDEPIFASDCSTIKPYEKGLICKFLFQVLKARQSELYALQLGMGQPHVYPKDLAKFEVPFPPLEVQQEIVAEIEGYQRVIDGARAVIDNYRPSIEVDPEWPMVELGKVCDFTRGPFGGSLKKDTFAQSGYAVYEQRHAISKDFTFFRYFIDEVKYKEMKRFEVFADDIIMSCSGTMGRTAIVPANAPVGIINQALLKLKTREQLLTRYLKIWMDGLNFKQSIEEIAFGAGIRNVASVKTLKKIKIPLPSLSTQRTILAEIEAEQALVAANQELIRRLQDKIRVKIACIWGDDMNYT